MLRFALAGNPNSGKTTLFNCLTGSTAHVGNWPGVTVDKREGLYKKCKEPISIVDLPGIYSLSPYSPEEVISRNYILDEKPDCVINIVDVTNLERNLYLTTQVMEIDVPVVIALNMSDVLKKNGDKIDEKELEKRLGVPVVVISALKNEGLDELMERAYEASKKKRIGKTVLEESELAHVIGDVKIALEGQGVENPLFHAIKLIENDEIERTMHAETVKMVEAFKKTFKNDLFGVDFEALIADARYKYICKHYSSTLTKKIKGITDTRSDKIDRVLTNKWAGIPLFLVILFTIFHLTFSEDFLWSSYWGLPSLEALGVMVEGAEGELEPVNFGIALFSCLYDGVIYSPGVVLFNLMDLLTSTVFGWLTEGIASLGASEWAISLIGDGVLGGLAGVLSFVPQIIMLLLLLSILEDTGYMARVAFILDRIFRKFGVSGRAFIPMIMGFGCSIPAMVNTRTLLDERERTLTIRTIPFFSCGAKLPILVAVAGAVGNMLGLGDGAWISYAMYVVGMALAVISIIVMRSTTQRGEVAPFIMELPAYRLPSGKALMIHLWDKTKHYIEKVFTIILASTIIVWFASSYGWDWRPAEIQESILASLGQFLQPLFTPLGFGSQLNEFGWVFVVAAITGLIAKEEVIATFGTLSALFTTVVAPELAVEGATDVMLMTIGTGITWQALVAFIIFNMTTIPCFAAVAAARGEINKGKFKWTILFWVVASYIATSFVYTVLSWWWTAFIWAAVIALVTLGIVIWNKKFAK
ncbi:MAG: ferrous iron transporter B [Clostridia bacterium]|nr:ferrous iron transporter B [Clostridia bacterium]